MKHHLIILIALCALIGCKKVQTATAEMPATEPVSQDSNPGVVLFTPHSTELFNEILHSMEARQSIVEYGPVVKELQTEMLNFVDTCPDQELRLLTKHLANMLSLDLMKATSEDSVQFHYYADSLIEGFNRIDGHWFVFANDTATLIENTPYLVEDDDLHQFRITLLNQPGTDRDVCMIEFPVGATSNFHVGFATADGPFEPKEIIVEGGDVVVSTNPVFPGIHAMIMPLQAIYPLMLKYDMMYIGCSFGEDESAVDKHTLMVLFEFHHQFGD